MASPLSMAAQIESTTEPMASPVPQSILTTTRLIVRPMHPSDAQSMALHANSPLVAKYMSLAFPHPYTSSSADTWISMNLAKPEQTDFCICERSCPEVVIGGIGLKLGADINSHTAEVGYWVGEQHWGKGYITECLEAFTRWSLVDRRGQGTRITRLWGGVLGGNGASMRCFEKCGYVKEGVLKGHCEKYGEAYDLHLFGITKGDWERRMSNVFNNY